MSLQTIDHLALAEAQPSEKLSNHENFQKLIKIFIAEAQKIEDALQLLAHQKDLDTVEGVWLDYIGKIVGEGRFGRGDEEYRQALKLKIAINSSDGTASRVYEIIKTYTNSDKVRIAEGILSWGQVIFDGEDNADASLWQLMQDIKPLTVGHVLIQNTEKKCFFPAWEVSIEQTELFQVFLGGTSEALDLVIEDSVTLPLFVAPEGHTPVYDEDTTGSFVLEWEEPNSFELFDGDGLELQLDEDTVEYYLPEGVSFAVNNDTLLPWEITRDSSIGIYGLPQQFSFFNGTDTEDLQVQLTTHTQEDFYVNGVIL